jgi:probable rRNA maturation factor
MIEINNIARASFDARAVKEVVESFLKKFKLRSKDVSLGFVTGREMKRLNEVYRGKKGTTDILSFDGDGDLLGELVIDHDQIKKQAKELGHSAKHELLFIVVHGLLHLIGRDDETEEDRLDMVAEGEKLLSQFTKK